MSRPLTCDCCNKPIKAVVTPIKVAINGDVPDEMKDMTYEEITMVVDTARRMGATVVPQQMLDFCSSICLAMWAWRESNLPLNITPVEAQC